MTLKALVNFSLIYDNNYTKNVISQDGLGYAGAFLSKPLIMACGRHVVVSSSASGLTFLTAEKRSTIQRIFFAVMAFALLPLTLIGLACTACSKAHSNLYEKYNKNTAKPTQDSELEKKRNSAGAKIEITPSGLDILAESPRSQGSLSPEHFKLLPKGVEIPEPSESINPNQFLTEIESLPNRFSYYSEHQKAPFDRKTMLKQINSMLSSIEQNNSVQKLLKHFLIHLRTLSTEEKMVTIQRIEWFKCPDRLMKDLKRSYLCTNGLGEVLDLPNAMRQKVLEIRREAFAIAVSKVLDPIFEARPCERNKTHYTSSYNYYDRIFRVEFGLGGDPHEPPSIFESSLYYDQARGFNYICDQAHANQIRARFHQIYTSSYVLERMLSKLNNAPGFSDLCAQCIEHLRAHHPKLLEQEDLSNGFTSSVLSKILVDCGILN
jgi:hypothetical protein